MPPMTPVDVASVPRHDWAMPSPVVSRHHGQSRNVRESFIVKDANGQQLAYLYFEDEPQRQMSQNGN